MFVVGLDAALFTLDQWRFGFGGYRNMVGRRKYQCGIKNLGPVMGVVRFIVLEIYVFPGRPHQLLVTMCGRFVCSVTMCSVMRELQTGATTGTTRGRITALTDDCQLNGGEMYNCVVIEPIFYVTAAAQLAWRAYDLAVQAYNQAVINGAPRPARPVRPNFAKFYYPFVLGGDSGSLIVKRVGGQLHATALLYGGSTDGQIAYACDVEQVGMEARTCFSVSCCVADSGRFQCEHLLDRCCCRPLRLQRCARLCASRRRRTAA